MEFSAIVKIDTSPFNARPGTLVRYDPAGGGVNVCLPTAVNNNGKLIVIKNVTSQSASAVISAADGEYIDGLPFTIISGSHVVIRLLSDGISEWLIV
jgi:hypothetical protein